MFARWVAVAVLLSSCPVWAHLCDNVFRQANMLIVKPETYNLTVKDRATFKIFLQNNMDRGIAEVVLRAESPSFTFSITPSRMAVPKDARVFFEVTMTPKSGVRSGNYPITFRLTDTRGREFTRFEITGTTETSSPARVSPSTLLTVVKGATAPVVDGALTDTSWRSSAVASNFSSAAGGRASAQTTLLLSATSDALFLGAYCQDAAARNLSASDKVEVLISPHERGVPYLIVSVPAQGTPTVRRVLPDGNTEPVQDPSARCAVARFSEGWSVELSLPFAVLGKTPAGREQWWLRVVRTKATVPAETSYWADDGTGYNREKAFGQFLIDLR